MPSRGFNWRGFKLRVSYPKRRRRAPIEAYEPATPPVVQPPVRRDPQRALDFLRDPSLQGDGKQPNPITQKYLVEAAAKRSEATSLAQLVAGIPWYHTIELGDGVVTPGSHDHRNFVNLVGLPEDLTGKRVLDVATFDGFWAFEFERRGAEVVAIDLPSTSHLDLPGKASDIVKAEGLDLPHGEAFHIAHQALKSKAKWLACSVYDLDPAVHGTFDLVFVGDVLLHLRNSLDALRRVRDVARDRFIMVDRYDPSISGTGERLLRYEGGWNGMEWWAPSLETLQQWVVDAGFAPPTMHGTYQVRGEDRSNAGWFRAVLHSHVV